VTFCSLQQQTLSSTNRNIFRLDEVDNIEELLALNQYQFTKLFKATRIFYLRSPISSIVPLVDKKLSTLVTFKDIST